MQKVRIEPSLFHEREGAVGQFVVDFRAYREREGLDTLERSISLLLVDPDASLNQDVLGNVSGVVRLHDLGDICGGIPRGVRRDPVVAIEAVSAWQALGIFAEVPLAEDGGSVTGVMEHFAHRVGRARKGIGPSGIPTSDSPLRMEYWPVISATAYRRPRQGTG